MLRYFLLLIVVNFCVFCAMFPLPLLLMQDVIYLDFKKAFDEVSHGGLLSINSLGIGDKLLKWLLEYLSHRQQLVSINGVKSSLFPVTSGVPQREHLWSIAIFGFYKMISFRVSTAMKTLVHKL